MLPGIFSTSYQQDMAVVRTKAQWFLLALSLVFVFTIPLYASLYWLTWFRLVFIWIIAVLGLHILTGLCGLFSMAQAAFMAVGAYTTAILCGRFGWSPWASLPMAGIAASVVGLVCGVPALRIKAFYFVMATLAASFVITWMIGYFAGWTGGVEGIYVAPPQIGGADLSLPVNAFYLAAVLAILGVLLAKNIQRTQTGRAFIAIRDNELAAQVMGVNLFRYKSLALLIAGFYAGIAGWLYAHSTLVISPDHFPLTSSVWMIGMLIVGGLGSTAGAIAGVVFLKLLDTLSEYLVPALSSAFPSASYAFATGLGTLLYALAILLFIVFQPRGLYHRWERLKVAYRLFPYSY
jgi:branched-chain amino acid transport system permease protein